MEEFIKIAFVIIVLLVSAGGQILKDLPKKKKPKRPQRPMNPNRPLPAKPQMPAQQQQVRRPPAQQVQPQRGLEAEIEDFLKKVTRPAKRQQQARPLQAEVVDVQPIQGRQRPPQQVPDRGIQRGESVAEHVHQHMDVGGLDERDAHLAETIEYRDDAMNAHVREVFDHDLGQLSQKASAQANYERVKKKKQFSASDIRGFFKNSDDVRKAIIMNEILRRKTR